MTGREVLHLPLPVRAVIFSRHFPDALRPRAGATDGYLSAAELDW